MTPWRNSRIASKHFYRPLIDALLTALQKASDVVHDPQSVTFAILTEMAITLRQATEADLDKYTSLLQRTYEIAYVNPDLGLVRECFSKEVFETKDSQRYLLSNLSNNDRQQCWLAIQESNPIGAITIIGEGKEIEVRGFYVAPELQGQGIGKMLWEKAVEFSKGRNIVLDTYVHNTKTIEMYRKWGFELDVSRGDGGYFYRHWAEWPEGLQAKCLYMRLRQS
jgi:ribosomal protein S18 acetylase RimI-like enzyme